MKSNTKSITQIALVTAMYVALTLVTSFFSYLTFNLRIAEILILLVFFNKKYSTSLILGCFIANCFSPLGFIDMIVGTFATIFACFFMTRIKNYWVASLFPTISGIFIAIEISFITHTSFWLNLGSCLLGEFIVVSIIGCPIMLMLSKNKNFAQLIDIKNFPYKLKQKNYDFDTNSNKKL